MKPVVIIVTIKIPMILTLIFLLLIQLAIPPVTGAMWWKENLLRVKRSRRSSMTNLFQLKWIVKKGLMWTKFIWLIFRYKSRTDCKFLIIMEKVWHISTDYWLASLDLCTIYFLPTCWWCVFQLNISAQWKCSLCRIYQILNPLFPVIWKLILPTDGGVKWVSF